MTDMNPHWGVSNVGSHKLLVWLEPWAEEFDVPVRSNITLTFSGEFECHEMIEVESTPDHLVVWASAGQTVRVFIDGNLQESASAALPVPGAFAGSTKQFLNLMFAEQPAARLGGQSLDAAGGSSWWQRAKLHFRLWR